MLKRLPDQRGAIKGGAGVLQGVRPDLLQEPYSDLRSSAAHRHLARVRPKNGEGPQRGPPALHAGAGTWYLFRFWCLKFFNVLSKISNIVPIDQICRS